MADAFVNVAVGIGVALRADVNLLEVILLLGVLLAARSGWPRRPAWLGRLESAGRAFARRRRTAVAGVITLAVLARLALLPLVPMPHPGGADEFSHSLLGDTLASGRLTNPPHPLWVHFESRHIIHQPTYNSMYFPGQGAFLGFGKAVSGFPWAGVLLSTALFCGAVTWMLQGWVSPSWALLGGLLAILRIGLVSYWVNSFWGGSVTALGGALALGAWPRLRRRPQVIPALLFGVGLSLMAATRPFEGLAYSLPLLGALGVGVLRRRIAVWSAFASLAVVALTGAALAVYFRAVTGSPALLPYQVNQRTYGWPITLIWQDPPQVQHRHKELRDYLNWEWEEHQRLKAPGAALAALPYKAVLLWSFYLGPALTVTVAMAWRSLGQRRVRLALLAGGATLAATLVEQSSYPHYVSPVACVVFLVIINSFKYLNGSTKASLQVHRAVIVLVVLAVAFRLAAMPLGFPLMGPQRQLSWCCSQYWPNDRWPFEQRLRATEGRHLVIVHYGPSDRMRPEWVYNEADIDGAKIVWARDMGPEANAELVRYFSGRRLWLAEPDTTPPSLRPCN